ncbi:MAG: universal stress protein [Anaerolineae bacterium]|nr:universal stress protein [Anaerolineae bacterium]
MNAQRHGLDIRRIVVALDASPHSYAALEAAVRLASLFKADLLGLYVEDINVLRLAELPFVREVGAFSTTTRRVQKKDLERQFRMRTLEISDRIAALASQQGVQQTFRVSRGKVLPEILEVSSDADVLIVGKTGWSQIKCRRWGSTARAIYADETPRLVMLLQNGTELAGPIMLVYDGSPLAQKALEVAAVLHEKRHGPLHVLVLVNGEKRAPDLLAEVASMLQDFGTEGHYQTLVESNIPKLARVIQSATFGTLILPDKVKLLQDDALLTLLEEIDIPILLVK